MQLNYNDNIFFTYVQQNHRLYITPLPPANVSTPTTHEIKKQQLFPQQHTHPVGILCFYWIDFVASQQKQQTNPKATQTVAIKSHTPWQSSCVSKSVWKHSIPTSSPHLANLTQPPPNSVSPLLLVTSLVSSAQSSLTQQIPSSPWQVRLKTRVRASVKLLPRLVQRTCWLVVYVCFFCFCLFFCFCFLFLFFDSLSLSPSPSRLWVSHHHHHHHHCMIRIMSGRHISMSNIEFLAVLLSSCPSLFSFLSSFFPPSPHTTTPPLPKTINTNHNHHCCRHYYNYHYCHYHYNEWQSIPTTATMHAATSQHHTTHTHTHHKPWTTVPHPSRCYCAHCNCISFFLFLFLGRNCLLASQRHHNHFLHLKLTWFFSYKNHYDRHTHRLTRVYLRCC